MKRNARRTLRVVGVAVAFVWVCAAVLQAEDWPRYRGTDGLGVWNETGIVETLPAKLPVRWRVPVKGGYSGPSVADGRVFITDFEYTKRPLGVERALALDEKTGQILWIREWEANYQGIGYDRGPGAIPTVDATGCSFSAERAICLP